MTNMTDIHIVQDQLNPTRNSLDTHVLTPDQIDRLVRVHAHRIINTLHHSAHNSETAAANMPEETTWDIELLYPSGYTERFIFSNPTKRGAKSARATEVVEDIIQTVRMNLNHSKYSEEFRNNICIRLQSAWKKNSFDVFEAAISTINKLMLERPLPFPNHLSPELVHHFFNQLYDRAVSPYTKDLNKTKATFTYGEIKPALLTRIFQQVGLTPQSIYLDLGSGIGNTVMQAALEIGCEAHGIEVQHYAHLVGVNHLRQFHARATLWGLDPGQVQLYFGNFLHSALIDDLLPMVDVLLVNNFKFDPTTDEHLRILLGSRLKVGAKVISTRPISPAGRSRSVDILYTTERCEYKTNSVSWTDSTGPYYIATKQYVAR